jgi:hypothetical protein
MEQCPRCSASDVGASAPYGGLVTTALEELAVRLRDFAAARDWEQFHTPEEPRDGPRR